MMFLNAADMGQGALILTLFLMGLQTIMVPYFLHQRKTCVHRYMRLNMLISFALLTLSFFTLIYAYIACDFGIKNVFENDHTQMPLFLGYTRCVSKRWRSPTA